MEFSGISTLLRTFCLTGFIIFLFSHSANSQVANYTVTYTYDETTQSNGIGRLTSVGDGSWLTKYSYDALGNPVQTDEKIDSKTYTFINTYDNLNRIKSVKYPDLDLINYSYNGPFLYYVYNSLPSNYYANYLNYNPLGQPGKIGYGDNESTNFTYSNSSNATCPFDNFRLCTIQTINNTTPTNIYQTLTYSYDSGGNILTIKDPDPNNGDQTFAYDGLNRLTSASGLYGAISFAYDELGNMTCNSRLSLCSNTNPNYFYPSSGLYSAFPHAVTRTGTSTNYNYDPNGNLSAGNGRTFTYNTENRPTTISAVTAGVNSTTNFVYDGYGNRIKKISPSGVTTTYIGKLYECTSLCIKYILAGDQRIGIKDVQTGDIYYYHPDHLGSSKVITKNGVVSEYLSYYPYGEIRAKPIASIDVHHKFTGQEYDDETGLYFYGARYYDPGLGRFVSPDNTNRFGNDPQKLNRYSYVLNNPVRFKDQTGKYEKDFHYYLTGLLAYYAGFSPQEALQIAQANQGIDDNLFSGPFLFDNSRENYHAFIGYFSSEDAVFKKEGPMRSAISNGDLRAFGGFLHFVQDYYSHARLGYGAFWGHTKAWKGPDYPFEHPENATNAAKQTIEELQMQGKKEGKTPIKSEDGVISSLFPFIHNRDTDADIRAQDLSNMDPSSFNQIFGNELNNKSDSNRKLEWDNLPPD